MHEYTECYLYYSLWQDETDPLVKKVWEQHFNDELSHLHKAVELLNKYENKVWEQVIPKGEFPELLKFRSNIDYVREVLKNTVNLTGTGEDYKPVSEIANDMLYLLFDGADILDIPEIISSIDYEYESELLNNMYKEEYYTMSVVEPLKK